ncbi:MAG: transporter [Deltaproteobacteria bacterium]|nr:transporter [Deltaproteobacteria bacterium]MBW1952660.1 transporter [Deltaproteobacteria bacterium]MBW1986211.1 transporter [Deltaproteobacteria bacterium]MBW2134108.1 transporter [Deltaproteobacteria bacterium]
MKRWLIWGMILFIGVIPLSAQATERGLAAYPDGVENFFTGAFPPPGVYYQNFLMYYYADHFKGGPPEVRIESFAQVFRLIYSSKVEILGGNWGMHVVLPLIYTGMRSKPINFSDYQFGLGNTCINPCILGWHFGDYHVTAGFEIIFPGSYNSSDAASPSQNYFTFQPVLALGWFPKSGFGITAKFMYDFPTNNEDPIKFTGARDHYHSGQAFHFDYCVDYAVLPNLRIGAAGYYYVQTTADTVDGREIGYHGREFAIGPAIKYDYKRFTFCLINQFEIAALNRPEGVRNWFRVWYAF